MNSRISEIHVQGLQETFEYHVQFPGAKDIVILIAPNGYGKTALLALLNACLQFRLSDAARLAFKTLEISFENGTRWCFEKTREEREGDTDRRRLPYRREHRPRDWVKVTFYDEKGRKRTDRQAGGIGAIPTDVLARALDRALPISRQTFDTFRDIPTRDLLSVSEVVERYQAQLLIDEDFRDGLGPYYQLFLAPGEELSISAITRSLRKCL